MAHGTDAPVSADSRDELRGLVDAYLDALVAHDPDAVPIAADVTFVENVEQKTPGEGLWQTATDASSNFRMYVPDPAAGQVGFLGRMEADGDPVLLGLRLAIEDGLITEMEHVVARNLRRGGEDHLDNLTTVRAPFRREVPRAERNTREELLAIGASYYDAIVEDDGSLAPLAENCVRMENGFQTTCDTLSEDSEPAEILRTLDAAEQLDTGAMSYIADIDPVRVEIADVETGLVCGLSQWRHPMEETTLDIVGVEGIDTVERDFEPFDLPALHVFKIRDGEIQVIEANGFRTAYDSQTGWE